MASGRLPNLLVAGVPKAGTGALFAYLRQHPDICPADMKEVGYFNYFNPQRQQGEPPPIESYMQHFAHCGAHRYAMEATPTYSYGGKPVIAAVQRILGQPKIIITMRDPVDRLWSAYTFQRTLGNLPGFDSFEEYLDACERRRRDGSDLVPRDHLHGLHIGYYADYVGDWLDAFGDDLRILFADETRRDTRGVLGGVFEWLDVDPSVTSTMDLLPRNTTQHARSPRVARLVFSAKRSVDRLGRLHPAMRRPVRRAYERLNAGEPPKRPDPATRARVEELYRASNQELARVLTRHGYRNLPAWLVGQTVRD